MSFATGLPTCTYTKDANGTARVVSLQGLHWMPAYERSAIQQIELNLETDPTPSVMNIYGMDLSMVYDEGAKLPGPVTKSPLSVEARLPPAEDAKPLHRDSEVAKLMSALANYEAMNEATLGDLASELLEWLEDRPNIAFRDLATKLSRIELSALVSVCYDYMREYPRRKEANQINSLCERLVSFCSDEWEQDRQLGERLLKACEQGEEQAIMAAFKDLWEPFQDLDRKAAELIRNVSSDEVAQRYEGMLTELYNQFDDDMEAQDIADKEAMVDADTNDPDFSEGSVSD